MTTVYAQSAVRDTGNIADAYTGASRERRLKKAVSNIIDNMVAIPDFREGYLGFRLAATQNVNR